jgi:polyisoprenoid-binding protein YceI
MRNLLAVFVLVCGATIPVAEASTTYVIDPNHTFPSFEADHMGVSVWRGKFNRTSGTVNYDRAANTGNVDIRIDAASVDFGLDVMNDKALTSELFDVAKYPDARYVGKLVDFVNGAPTRVDGELTLRGVTRPVDLEIRSFKCVPHPLNKRELCGADAVATFKRDEFGMDAGKAYGFDMDVTMQIQVEALKSD